MANKTALLGEIASFEHELDLAKQLETGDGDCMLCLSVLAMPAIKWAKSKQ
jgi:hypothetical protein